jgi:salicylate hydroxylase
VRTARVTLESRHLWQIYHAGGIARDVYLQMLGERSEADTFQCLAWLYDGFALPAEAEKGKGKGEGKGRVTAIREAGHEQI